MTPPSTPTSTGASVTSARLPEEEAVSQCGDAIYYWYPIGHIDSDPDYFDGWNWRFNGTTREVQAKGGEWRVVFANTASENSAVREEARLQVDGVPQDGYADSWCETHLDGTFDVGIVGGASLTGKTLRELVGYMVQNTRI